MEITVREIRLGDERRISEIHFRHNSFFEEDYVSPDFISECLAGGDFNFLVAESGGEIAGFCGMLYHLHVGRAEIGPIAVEDGFKGRGVGRILLEKAFDLLKEIGVLRVIVKVKAENSGALGFFQNQGFTPEGRFENYTRTGDSVVQMVRFI
ncbi:MAG TPA: GNAT family N-acetyltransferase [Candidatus Altiarchaeales archaeon]|nr:GNAT family N-acetyltransferase [Candidatus Altiarchaeales archaeon]